MPAEDREGPARVPAPPTAAPAKLYRFAEFELDPSVPSLKRGDDEIHLRFKTFQVLLYLIEQRDRCVPKQELWERLWPDSAVTDDALVQCVKDIRRALGDDVREPRFIRTLTRVGYRFIAPVEQPADTPLLTAIATPLPPDPPARDEPLPVARGSHRLFRFAAMGAILLLAGLGIASRMSWSSGADASTKPLPTVAGKTSVMVMYLDNESKDADIDWLRSGLADMLISGLTRSDRLTVMGRQQLDVIMARDSSPIPRLPLDRARAVAAQAHAERLVLGTFGRLGTTLRVDVQLYNTATGHLITSDRLLADRPEKILTEIDLLSMRLADRLGNAAPVTATLPDVMTDNLEAYRNYSLGVERAHGLMNQDAIALFQRAVALDPKFAMAHARIGYAYAVTWGRNELGKPYLQKAFNLSDRLTAKDRLNISAWYAIASQDFPEAIRIYKRILASYPGETEAYHRLCILYLGEGDLDGAMDAATRGLAVDPESPELHNVAASAHHNARQYGRAIQYARRYVELASPKPNAYDTLGILLAVIGDYEGANAAFERALAINPTFEIARIHLGNTYARQGRYRDAAAEFRRYIDAAPSDLERARGWESLSIVARRLGRIGEARQHSARIEKYASGLMWERLLEALERGDSATVERGRSEIENRLSNNRGSRGNGRFREYQLGTIALLSNRPDEALTHLREAVRLAAPTWHIDDYETCLADGLVELGRYSEAIAEYERVLKVNPNYGLARHGLAEAYRLSNQPASAAHQYRRFLEVWALADRDIPEIMSARAHLAALTTH